MPLNQEEQRDLEVVLDECDAALADKQTLSRVFGPRWRAEFRKRALTVDSLLDVGFPEAYYAPRLNDMPPDYQQRIEEGISILWTRLNGRDRKDFVSRLRDREPASATEELLLARGSSIYSAR
jgi:hypothetical protein